MGALVDLTLTLGGPRMTPVPGLPGVEFEPVHTHAQHHRSNTRVVMATHVGTHVDAPYHFVPNGPTIDQVPLERCVGPGVLVDLRGRWQRRQPIGAEALAGVPAEELAGRIVLLFSGWAASEAGGPALYTENPHMAPELAQALVGAGVRAVGVDFPVDPVPEGPSGAGHFPVHRILLGAGVPIIENLVGLEALVGRRFEVWALPVKFYRGDGGASRVVARLLDE